MNRLNDKESKITLIRGGEIEKIVNQYISNNSQYYYNFDYLWSWIRDWFDEDLNLKIEITKNSLHLLPFGCVWPGLADPNNDVIKDVKDWICQRDRYLDKMYEIITNSNKDILIKIYGQKKCNRISQK